MSVNITTAAFGDWDGKAINKYTISEIDGIQVSIINYGAAITNIIVPEASGSPADIVLGFDSLEGYIKSGHFFIGGICGRYANRIANASFHLDGRDYQLSKNDGTNCLHGGFRGFDKRYWEANILPEKNAVRFVYESIDGEEGFPGNMHVEVVYTVADHALHIEYSASTDKACPVNLTNHAYFNLSGGTEGDILEHELELNANKIVEVNEQLIPTGQIRDTRNTALDFTNKRKIGERSGTDTAYDYSWILEKKVGEIAKAAMLYHPRSGRQMTIYTTQPAVHFYSGHFLDGNLPGAKGGSVYGKFAGFCLETQHFPDSPNHPDFPGTIIKPGELYKEKTIFSFGRSIDKKR